MTCDQFLLSSDFLLFLLGPTFQQYLWNSLVNNQAQSNCGVNHFCRHSSRYMQIIMHFLTSQRKTSKTSFLVFSLACKRFFLQAYFTVFYVEQLQCCMYSECSQHSISLCTSHSDFNMNWIRFFTPIVFSAHRSLLFPLSFYLGKLCADFAVRLP